MVSNILRKNMSLKYEVIVFKGNIVSYGRYGISHRKDGPAMICHNGDKYYRLYGMLIEEYPYSSIPPF